MLAAPPVARLIADNGGNISVIFALALVPLVAAIGCAVDFGMAMRQRTKLQNAVDTAVLAGAIAGRDALNAGNGISATKAAAEDAATKFFAGRYAGAAVKMSPVFTIAGLTVTGTASASDRTPNNFMSVFGQPTFQINVTASSQSSAQTYMNLYLLVDISTSMLLPSTATGINQMRSATGCALACHDNANNNDSYGYALKNNIQLRYQVVNQGVQNLLSFLNSDNLYRSHVKVGLWSLDSQIKQMSSPTYNYNMISANFPAPELAVNDTTSATPFDNLIDGFINTVGSAGDGSSMASPQKMVIIATDGVNEPTRAWNVDPAWRPYVKVFDTTFCKTFKKNGVTIAIINTPYYPMTWDWGYQATLGQPGSLGGATRVDDIPIALSACAGKNFISASSVQEIQSAFTTLFTQAAPVRITK